MRIALSVVALALVGIGAAAAWRGTQDQPWTAALPSTPDEPGTDGWRRLVRLGQAVQETTTTSAAIAGRPATIPDQGRLARELAGSAQTRLDARVVLDSDAELRPPRSAHGSNAADLAAVRRLARLLRASSALQAAQGDLAGSADSSLGVLRLGLAMTRGADLLGWRESMIVQSIGRSGLWGLSGRLDAVTAVEAVKRLISARTMADEMQDVLQQERQNAAAAVARAVRSHSWRPYVCGTVVARGLDWQQCAWYGLAGGAQREWRAMDAIARRQSAAAKLPYSQAVKAIEESRAASRALSFGPGRSYLFGAALNETENRLLAITMALRAYRLRTREFPDQLGALVPGYLPAALSDPFDGKTLRYRRTDGGYLLYSVGPDQRDDHGRAVGASASDGRDSRAVHADSIGDVVAGVNLG